MLIYKFLKECPKFVSFLNKSIKFRIIIKEIFHFSHSIYIVASLVL